MSEAGLTSAAKLLRQVHDASAGFVPPDDARWAFAPEVHADVVCHGDPGPWNFVWRDGLAVALIDWEHACPRLPSRTWRLPSTPSPRSDPMTSRRPRLRGAARPARRLMAFAAAYGTGGTPGLVDRVIDRQQLTVARVLDLAERGFEPWASWVRSGGLDDLRARTVGPASTATSSSEGPERVGTVGGSP